MYTSSTLSMSEISGSRDIVIGRKGYSEGTVYQRTISTWAPFYKAAKISQKTEIIADILSDLLSKKCRFLEVIGDSHEADRSFALVTDRAKVDKKIVCSLRKVLKSSKTPIAYEPSTRSVQMSVSGPTLDQTGDSDPLVAPPLNNTASFSSIGGESMDGILASLLEEEHTLLTSSNLQCEESTSVTTRNAPKMPEALAPKNSRDSTRSEAFILPKPAPLPFKSRETSNKEKTWEADNVSELTEQTEDCHATFQVPTAVEAPVVQQPSARRVSEWSWDRNNQRTANASPRTPSNTTIVTEATLATALSAATASPSSAMHVLMQHQIQQCVHQTCAQLFLRFDKAVDLLSQENTGLKEQVRGLQQENRKLLQRVAVVEFLTKGSLQKQEDKW